MQTECGSQRGGAGGGGGGEGRGYPRGWPPPKRQVSRSHTLSPRSVGGAHRCPFLSLQPPSRGQDPLLPLFSQPLRLGCPARSAQPWLDRSSGAADPPTHQSLFYPPASKDPRGVGRRTASVSLGPRPGCSGRRNAEKSLKLSRPGWTEGSEELGRCLALGAHTYSADTNPDTSTGTDHVHADKTMRPPTSTSKRGPHPGSCPLPQNHGHTKARAGRMSWIKFPKTHKRTSAQKTPEAPADAHGPGSEPLSPGSPF